MPGVTDIRTISQQGVLEPLVYIVDDEPDVRDAIGMLLDAEGLTTRCFQTGQEFLDHCSRNMQGCVLLDLCMPDYSGLEIQKILAERNVHIPIIFLTGHGTIPASSEAFRSGAFDFLEKPFDNEVLLQRVAQAFDLDAKRHASDHRALAVSDRYARLSDREKQVLRFIVNGYSSKEMAKEMGISHRTVEIYRINIMRKMNAESLVELMRLVTPLFDQGELPR